MRVALPVDPFFKTESEVATCVESGRLRAAAGIFQVRRAA